MDPQTSLARLQATEARDGLVELLAAHALDTPISQLVDPGELARSVVVALRAAVADDTARDRIVELVKTTRHRLAAVDDTPRAWVPPEAMEPLQQLVATPWSPSEELTYRLINHAALRTMLREVLSGSLERFTSKMRNLDQGMLGGLGGRAVKRGRGLLGAASSLVSAVKDEMESAFEGRLKEHLGQATDEAVRTIARWISDPAHADALGSMRVSALEALLDTPVRALAAEGDAFDPGELADVVLAAMRQVAARDDLESLITSELASAVEALGDGTLGTWLEDLGLREPWLAAARPLVERQVEAITRSERFEAWWLSLHS